MIAVLTVEEAARLTNLSREEVRARVQARREPFVAAVIPGGRLDFSPQASQRFLYDPKGNSVVAVEVYADSRSE